MPKYSSYRSRSSSSRTTRYTPRSMRRLQKNAQKHLILYLILGGIFIIVMAVWVGPFLVGGLTYFNRYKTVEKIENSVEDTAVAPPVLNIPFEATNTATIKVTGYATSDAKIELYVGNDLKDTINTESDGNFEVPALPITEGINAIYAKTVVDNKTSLPSKSIRISYSAEKPATEISEPTDNQEVKGGDKKIKVSGTTDPNNSVTINGAYIIINSEGKFTHETGLNDGDNTITIQTTNKYGSIDTIERKIKYTAS